MINWLSPLAFATYLTFVIGSFLIFWSVFKHELSTADKIAIVEQRKQSLPLLRRRFGKYLTYTDKLTANSMLYDLSEYTKRLKRSRKGFIGKLLSIIEHRDAKGALYEDIKREFLINNVIFGYVKDTTETKVLKSEISNLVSQDRNRRLSKQVERMFKVEHISHSYRIFLKLSRDKFEPDLLNEKFMLWAEQVASKTLRDGQARLNRFIASLEQGEDL